jgi:glycosyltransferase involved in cell wall biosynthesis
VRILILNRRDIANPAGGGAETYTHEIAKGLVNKYNCEVTVFSSSFIACKADEAIEGVRYVRRGNEVTVHLHGFWYAFLNRSRFDRIIDEFNGVGFLTFFLPNSILLIHQLYREFWLKEFKVAGLLPYLMEPLLLRRYRKKRTITVSDSTKKDLEGVGFRDIRIVMNAIGYFPLEGSCVKEEPPALIFLGRLRSTKRPEYAIEVFRRAKEKIPNLKLWMVGRGPDEEKLKEKAKGLDGVIFWGWADEELKISLLRRAFLLIVPSVREGFGINVIEAAAAGTPAIGFDVPGLRDSIGQGETGYLVGSVGEAAERIAELLSDGERYAAMSAKCLEYSKEFRWEKRVAEFWRDIGGEMKS